MSIENRNIEMLDFRLDNVESSVEIMEKQIITEVLQVTVGIGGDIETLHEALQYAASIQTIGNGVLALILLPGTHILDPDNILDPFYGHHYSLQHITMVITSVAGRDLTFVTIPEVFDEGYIFLMLNSTINFIGVTFDGTLGGHVNGGSNQLMYGTYQSLTEGCTFKNFDRTMISNGVITFEGNCIFEGNTEALRTGHGSKILLYQSPTFNNNDTALFADYAGQIMIKSDTTIVFSGNTTDTNIPMNEIQYDNSLISDSKSTLTFKV